MRRQKIAGQRQCLGAGPGADAGLPGASQIVPLSWRQGSICPGLLCQHMQNGVALYTKLLPPLHPQVQPGDPEKGPWDDLCSIPNPPGWPAAWCQVQWHRIHLARTRSQTPGDQATLGWDWERNVIGTSLGSGLQRHGGLSLDTQVMAHGTLLVSMGISSLMDLFQFVSNTEEPGEGKLKLEIP